MAVSDPAETGTRTPLALEPRSDTLPQRIWWGFATRQSARWAGEQGFHLLSTTLLSGDTGVPFARLQAEQISVFRDVWRRAGEPDAIADDPPRDEAVQAADTLLVTIPNLLGVAEKLRLLTTIAENVAPAPDWNSTPTVSAAHS
ncbi:hypothetical protein [Umezawaea beigongshangensis]|uniref:hypothetical protein n=1 Tax=Umezawaea beigongshangensis TaxID=2780383 RepID=UPI001E3AB1FE|nr:hypothetical protein [Umezawaea beigongshangensis]